MTPQTHRAALSVFALTIATVLADGGPLRAATKVKLTDVRIVRETGEVSVGLTSPTAVNSAEMTSLNDAKNWKVFLRGRELTIQTAREDLEVLYFKVNEGLPAEADLASGDLEVRYLPGAFAVNRSPARPEGKHPKLVFTKSKKDADIVLTGGLQAGVGASPQYFWSAKAAYPFYPGSLGRHSQIAAQFESEASKQKNADPDAMKASVVLRKRWSPAVRTGFHLDADLLGYEFERAIKSEAVLINGQPIARKFLEKNSNIAWAESIRFVHAFRPVNYNLGAGFETGRALTRTVKADSHSSESQSIFRPRFDVDAYRDFFTPGAKKTVGVDGHYTIRLPQVAEPFQRAGVNGDEPFLTKKPRHYVKANVNVFINAGTAITVTYMWGSLPPSFEFVDHQVTIGFTLLLAREEP